jgi:hypothetical protein
LTHFGEYASPIETRNSILYAYEFKWSKNARADSPRVSIPRVNIPKTFKQAYPNAQYKIMTLPTAERWGIVVG